MCLEILITKKEMVLTGHLFWVSVQASINCGPRKAFLTKADFMTDRSVVPKRNQTMITHCHQSDWKLVSYWEGDNQTVRKNGQCKIGISLEMSTYSKLFLKHVYILMIFLLDMKILIVSVMQDWD